MALRKVSAVLMVTALLFALVLPGAALAQGQGKGKGKGNAGARPAKGKLTVEGTVTAVNSQANSFTLLISKPGHQKRAGGESITVVLQTATLIKVRGGDDDDDDDGGVSRRAATIADLHVGDRVQVQGIRLDDGSMVANRLDVKHRAAAGGGIQPPGGGGVVASGVVIAKAVNSMTVAGQDGVQRLILVNPGTSIRGQRGSFAEIQPSDVVTVQGTVNADGTISARSIEVTFTPGTTMTGQITAKSQLGTQFIILNGVTAVHVSGDTRILSGGVVRSFADLQVGQTVTVSGNPITVGGVTVGINARVITF